MKRLVLTLAICLGCMGILGAQNNIWKPITCDTPLLGAASNGDLFAMAGYSGLLRSQDEGETWEQVNGNYMHQCIAFSPQGRIFVFPSSYTYLQYSDDGGDTWQQTTIMSSCAMNDIGGIYAVSNDTVLVWSFYGEMYYTLDGGTAWSFGGIELDEYHQVGDVIVNEAGDVYASKWYFSGEDSGIFHSTLSDMQNWELVAFDGAAIHQMEFDPEGNIVAGALWGSLGGFQHEPGFYLIDGQTIAVSDNGIVYHLRYNYSDYTAVLNYSTDHGEHFFDVGEALPTDNPAPGGGSGASIFKGYDNHLYFHGNGQYWKSVRDADYIRGNFPLENTAWVQFYRSMYEDSTYYQLGIKGDTVVNETAYKKVINCAHLGYPIEGECFGGIREDADGKCYFMSFVPGIYAPWPLHYDCEVNTEYPLYDFSLSVCDVFPTIGLTPHVVFDTTSMQLNGSTRKVLWFGNNCDSGNPYERQWIEGIGSTHSLLYPIQWEPDNGPEYRLVEVWQNEEMIYRNPHFEDYVPMIKEGNQRQKWNVVYLASMNYPNDYFTEIQSIRDDITLDGVDYKLVWHEDVYDSKRIAGAVREEDKRVYFRIYWGQSYQDEALLYDFNLNVGDTVTVNWMGQQLMVMEESEVEVNGTMRRQLGLAMYFGNGIAGEVEEYWIEGVGSTYGFLNSGYEGFDGSFVHLLCYHENGNLIWDNEEFDDCVMNSDGAPATFAPQGSEWYFNVFSFMNSPTTYFRMAVEGDTLIQGHQCSVITRQYLGGNGDKQYVYEENNKVYWYNATLDAFTTLYDFDAEEGESWICHIDSCSYEVAVQSVEQVTWGGRTYRVQNIASVEGEFFYFYYGRIIEGIGSVEGLFPYPYACVGEIYCGPYPDYLRCYLVDGEMLYHEGDFECDAVLPWQYPCWDGTVAETYDGGNGTAEDPYQIATPQQLALLAQQTNDGTGGDAYYLLTDDICLNANLEMWYINWKPIGRVTDSTVAYFRGHFDGNGKTISKLLCETNEMMTDPVIGLFGCTDGAEIVNVNLSDCLLTGGEYAGGLVGYAGSTDISNCSVQNSQITTTGGVAGGIVGYAGMPFRIHETNENVSRITNCEIDLVTVESAVDAGGIVGKINDDSYYARYLVSNCNANNEQYFHVKGSVSGGIVGEMRYGTVEGCASNTIVVGTGQVINVCTGGIAGSIHGSSVIANSYNRGNVVADFEFAGGIVGYSAGNVYNVYNAGEIYMPDPNSSGYGTIIGNVQAGERLNCYWLENGFPSAGNPILPDMPGSTSFHQGSTATSWVLDESQYGTSDLLEALNLGPHDEFIWLEDVGMTNGGLPIPMHSEAGFPLHGSEWYYEILNDDGSITYQYMYQSGDTIVNDEPTQILVKINTLYDKGRHQEVTHEYVFERDGKVYWWNKTLEEFTVLYDLDAQPGDSWVIKVGTETLIMHVDAVEQYEYEGITYKMLQVSDEGDIFSGIIVCGIGHLTSFFPERLMTKGRGYRVEGIRCYWREGELVFKYGDKDCNEVYQEYHIGIEEDGPSTGSGTLTVYPNPTNGVLFVETRHGTSLPDLTYRITNLMGHTVLSGNITAETQQIDVTALPEGMYFITVGETTLKFVIR